MDQVLNQMQQFQHQFQQLCQEMLRMQAQLDSLAGMLHQTAGQWSGYGAGPMRTAYGQPYGTTYQQPYMPSHPQGSYSTGQGSTQGALNPTMTQNQSAVGSVSSTARQTTAIAGQQVSNTNLSNTQPYGNSSATMQTNWSTDQTNRGSATGRQSEYTSYGRLHD